MTTAEWHSTDDVLAMLNAAADTVSDRRLRLFMLACCESAPIPHFVTTFDRAIGLLREQLEGPSHRRTISRLREVIRAEEESLGVDQNAHLWCHAAELAACSPVAPRTAWELVTTILQASSDEDLPPIALRRSRHHADLLREILCPHISQFESEWRTETVRLLADGVHGDRAYDRLPILADALEEAGCGNLELLNHCLGPGPHLFGCWALDLVRGCY